MEAERKKEEKEEKKERQVSEKNTAFNIKERKKIAAAEARGSNPALMALYAAFLPGMRSWGPPKYVTDKYGNRIRNVIKEEKE